MLTKTRVAVFIPSGVGLGYTGPALFLKRLLMAASDEVEARVYAGERTGHASDPGFAPVRLAKAPSSPLEQAMWAIRTFVWIFADRNKVDLVHFHGTYMFKIVGALACVLLRIPFVLVPLASNADMGDQGKLTKWRIVRKLRRYIVGRAAAGFALGASVADELVAAGMPADRVVTIANPVSSNFFGSPRSGREELGRILFVGVLGERKRALLVLDAVAAIRRRGEAITAEFLGPFESTSFESEFRSKIDDLGLNGVVEHTAFSTTVSETMLNDASLLVLPSKVEGMPGAVVEAMAAGVPCLVTAVGSMEEIIVASGGGTIVEPTAESIADAAIALLRNPEMWQVFSKRSRDYATAHFSSKSVASIYVGTISRILGPNRSPLDRK